MAQTEMRRFHYLGEELPDLLYDRAMKVRTMVLGVGGGGSNSVNRLSDMDLDTAELVAFNTDVQKLFQISADRKLLLGQGMLHGYSTGGSPYLGRRAARSSRKDIDAMLKGTDVVFLVAGLGGGTGSGATPEIAARARIMGCITIGLVTIPFSSSGRLTRRRAERALKQLRKELDAMIIVPNDHLLEITPSLPVNQAFGLVDDALRSLVLGVSRGMTRSSLHDLRRTLGHCEVVLGMGSSEDPDEAVDLAVEWPLSEYGPTGEDPVLVLLSGGIGLDRATSERALHRLKDQLGTVRHYYWAVDQGIKPTSRTSVTVVIPSTSIRKQDPERLEDWLPAIDGASLLRPERA